MFTQNRNKELGQGLVELAILGSILIMVIAFIFMIGVNYNRYQDLSMRAARNARAMAYNPNFREHQRQVSLTMVEDNPVMDFTSSSIQPTYTPFRVGASDVWSDQLYYDYDPSADNWNDIRTSILDLPSQSFVVNGNYINLQTGGYLDQVVIVNTSDARKKRDRFPSPIPNLYDYKCMEIPNPTATWCWEKVDFGDIEKGDSISLYKFLQDGVWSPGWSDKEVLVLSKIDAGDTVWGAWLCNTLGLCADDLGSWLFVLNYQYSPIDGTINSKDFLDPARPKRTQGMRGEFDLVTGKASSEEAQTEKIELIEPKEKTGDITNTWTTDTKQEVVHHVNLNPNTTILNAGTAVAVTTLFTDDSKTGLKDPDYGNISDADGVKTWEIKNEIKPGEKEYRWETPKSSE